MKEAKKRIRPRIAKWSHLPGEYWIYAQRNDNTCGVAIAVSAIRYLGGDYDWDTVKEGVGYTISNGTYFDELVDYVNTAQSKNNYVIGVKSKLTFSDFNDRIFAGVDAYEAPPITGM